MATAGRLEGTVTSFETYTVGYTVVGDWKKHSALTLSLMCPKTIGKVSQYEEVFAASVSANSRAFSNLFEVGDHSIQYRCDHPYFNPFYPRQICLSSFIRQGQELNEAVLDYEVRAGEIPKFLVNFNGDIPTVKQITKP